MIRSLAIISFVLLANVIVQSNAHYLDYWASGKTLTGTVKWFNESKGIGFIAPDDGSEYVYVHFSAIDTNGFKTLKNGQKVEFEVVFGEENPSAANVKLYMKHKILQATMAVSNQN